ncbi:hypothetical protein Q9966_011732 [Columba livia]|nr:hypothetical protein Q9966_011732 [Columba livia]
MRSKFCLTWWWLLLGGLKARSEVLSVGAAKGLGGSGDDRVRCEGPWGSAGADETLVEGAACLGVADEEAFAEECRRRGQHALPFQPTNPRLLKSHKPASSPKYAYHYNSDEVEEQDRSRVTSSLETPFYLSGVHKHVDEKCAEKDPSDSQKPKPKSRARGYCCVLT